MIELLAATGVGMLVFNAALTVTETTASPLDQFLTSMLALAGAVITTVVWRLVEKYLPAGASKQPPAEQTEKEVVG